MVIKKEIDIKSTLEPFTFPFSYSHEAVEVLFSLIKDERFILIGEATHGTHEFYEIRAELSKKLIQEKSFDAILIEWDWPDVYDVNRFVQEDNDPSSLIKVMDRFKRFPVWMWGNEVVYNFIKWLTSYNVYNPQSKVGLYGMDLYSLQASLRTVINSLAKIDPAASQIARKRYDCFGPSLDPQRYGYATNLGLKKSCEEQVITQLLDLHKDAYKYMKTRDSDVQDEFFHIFQNALLVKNAEAYYRAMFNSDVSSWNIRDQHMFNVLTSLETYLSYKQKERAKIIIWAHNSHLGDARATDRASYNELNVGQLATQHYNEDVFKIGFSTFIGTVSAASEWGGAMEIKEVRPALDGSFEALFHSSLGFPNCIVDLKLLKENPFLLSEPMLQRAIGVIYRPDTERQSHYYYAALPQQFEALVHLDSTRAISSLSKETPISKQHPLT